MILQALANSFIINWWRYKLQPGEAERDLGDVLQLGGRLAACSSLSYATS